MSGVLSQVLVSIRQSRGGPGSRIYLAQLGTQLKRQGVLLDERLGVALSRMPDFCRIEGPEVVFLEGEPSDAPAAEAPLYLRRDLLLAMITDRPGTASALDLDSYAIVEVALVDGELGPPCSEEPIRWLRVPSLRTEGQIQFAEKELGPHLDAASLAALRRAGHRWTEVAQARLPAGTWKTFQDRRRQELIRIAMEWFQRHRIDSGRFLHRAPSAHAPRPPTAPGEELRHFLHRCIDEMTTQELAQVLVPAAVACRVRS